MMHNRLWLAMAALRAPYYRFGRHRRHANGRRWVFSSLRKAREHDEHLPVILMTSNSDVVELRSKHEVWALD